jgi:hypothetical protein
VRCWGKFVPQMNGPWYGPWAAVTTGEDWRGRATVSQLASTLALHYPFVAKPDWLLTVHPCTFTHSPHPPPWSLTHSLTVCT